MVWYVICYKISNKELVLTFDAAGTPCDNLGPFTAGKIPSSGEDDAASLTTYEWLLSPSFHSLFNSHVCTYTMLCLCMYLCRIVINALDR